MVANLWFQNFLFELIVSFSFSILNIYNTSPKYMAWFLRCLLINCTQKKIAQILLNDLWRKRISDTETRLHKISQSSSLNSYRIHREAQIPNRNSRDRFGFGYRRFWEFRFGQFSVQFWDGIRMVQDVGHFFHPYICSNFGMGLRRFRMSGIFSTPIYAPWGCFNLVLIQSITSF